MPWPTCSTPRARPASPRAWRVDAPQRGPAWCAAPTTPPWARPDLAAVRPALLRRLDAGDLGAAPQRRPAVVLLPGHGSARSTTWRGSSRGHGVTTPGSPRACSTRWWTAARTASRPLRQLLTGGDVLSPEHARRSWSASGLAPDQRLRPHRGHHLHLLLPHDRRAPARGSACRSAGRSPTPASTCSTSACAPVPVGVAGRAVHRRRRPGARLPGPAGPDRRALRARSVRRRRAPASTAPATSPAGCRTATSSSSAASTTRSRCAASASSWGRSRRRSPRHPGGARGAWSLARDERGAAQLVAYVVPRRPPSGRRARRRGAARATCAERCRSTWSRPPSCRSPRCRSPPTARSTARALPRAGARLGRSRAGGRTLAPPRRLERGASPRSGARCSGSSRVGVARQLLRPRRPLAAARSEVHGRLARARSGRDLPLGRSVPAIPRSRRSPASCARRPGRAGAAARRAPAGPLPSRRAAGTGHRHRRHGRPLPGAHDVDEFWRNLRDGVESITRFTDEELAGRRRRSRRSLRRSATTSRAERRARRRRRPVRRRLLRLSRRARPR